ncbi:hypothetical protein KY290_009245 [Solanum tuberosum]|uniref:Uncharacterized protein n=1 Tax=Solanum tuberosum TaxID=4113 RepID=A0ABQ7WAV3_SOLTU|nr:hypothetical protein KY290_009245 [Solanum tuberosum]
MMRAMDVRIMVIMGAMIIAMIKNRMGMRATIPEENMRKMVNISLMANMEKKALVVAHIMMLEHVRGLTLTSKVKMVPMIMSKHVTLPTPKMKYEEHALKAFEDLYSYSCANPYPSRSSVCGYTSSNQSHPRGRRECATLKSKDTLSYTSHGNAHYSGFRNKGRYEGCVKGLGSKRIEFPIFKGWRDPEEYLDWEWQCKQSFQPHDLRGPERPLYALSHLKGLPLGWWTKEERLCAL